MRVVVNGSSRETPEGTTLAGLLDEMDANRPGVAVAIHDEVVPRAQWPATVLVADAAVEVLTAVQGG